MPPIAIAVGDPTGIGPEITLKALAAELPMDETCYVLIGAADLLHQINRRLGLGLPLPEAGAVSRDRRITLIEPSSTPSAGFSFPPTGLPGSREGASASLAWLTDGARRCLGGEAAALVTGPVSKEAIIRAGQVGFVGQTEYLSALAGADRTIMMLLGCDERERWLRVALATTHLPIKEVPSRLRGETVELAIERAAGACRDLGLARARVAVCGLNPHAGEGGKMGEEEITIITPAVEAARSHGWDAQGPFAADALFHRVFQGEFDAVVAMYHDQGLVPLKMVAFETGVNWTLGLPFIRTSPDHGTAYDIAGKGQASPSSMISAVRLAKQLALRRAPRT